MLNVIPKLCLFVLLALSAAAYADECSQELLSSSIWIHKRTGDVIELKSNGKINCENKTNYRNECDYVYSSNFNGKPKSWKIEETSGINKLKVSFSRDIIFRTEMVEFSCEYFPDQKKIQVDEVSFIKISNKEN